VRIGARQAACLDIAGGLDYSALMLERAHKNPLPADWTRHLRSEWNEPYMDDLRRFLAARYREGATIYPPRPSIFAAFASTDFAEVKVVILGQDHYHGPGQAHGLCFSVPPGVAVPPSLRNIFREQKRDLGLSQPAHGDLTSWARQGVFLLNATLTVEAGRPASHHGRGWERLTDAAIAALSRHRQGIVFLLWGRFAQNKSPLIDEERHRVLRAPHPSPLSAHRGFIGCGHFSQTNEELVRRGMDPIDWQLPPAPLTASRTGDGPRWPSTRPRADRFP
jgi:uracil-DNA glycosylase